MRLVRGACEAAFGSVDGERAINGVGNDRATAFARAIGRDAESKAFAPEPRCSLGAKNGNLRAFYEVVPGDPDAVRIVAVGKKVGNVVRIAGKEIEL